uniref:Uncharacterized protein n=1 Tax=Glossina austeni TaxID=7395 RepID=A0A1A9V9V3_GLOAU
MTGFSSTLWIVLIFLPNSKVSGLERSVSANPSGTCITASTSFLNPHGTSLRSLVFAHLGLRDLLNTIRSPHVASKLTQLIDSANQETLSYHLTGEAAYKMTFKYKQSSEPHILPVTKSYCTDLSLCVVQSLIPSQGVGR